MLRHFPADHLSLESIVSVTRAGNTLVASTPASLTQPPRGFKGPEPMKKIVEDAQVAAAADAEKRIYGFSISFVVLG